MEVIRCGACNKKLAEAEYIRLSIKCPRCGALNILKAVEPLIRACPEFCVNGVGLKVGHPFFKLDSKAIERRFPIANGHRPFLTDVS